MSDISKKIRDIAEISEASLNDSDIKRIEKIALSLHLSDNDPFLSVLLTLEAYLRLCKGIPYDIKTQISEEISNKYKNHFLKLLPIFLLILCVVVIVFSFLSYQYGKKTGSTLIEKKYELEMIKIKGKGDFLQSDSFIFAYEMFENGDLEDIIYCRKRGWRIERDLCVPDSYYNNKNESYISTWKLPFK